MQLAVKLILMSLLTSCATTGYNRSFIMGDNRKVDLHQDQFVHVEKPIVPAK
jgi:hypothetical protein